MRKLKRSRRPEARPEEILDAALAVFVEKGFSASRMEDVARAASLSKGAVYLYFDSKEALFEALVRRFAERVLKDAMSLLDAVAVDDPAGAIRAAYQYLFALHADPGVSAAPRLVMAEAQRFPAIAQLYRREVIAVAEQAVAGLLTRAAERGDLRAVRPEAAFRVVLGPMIAHVLLSHVFGDPDAPPLDPKTTADAVADILLNGLKPRKENSPDESSPEKSAL
jgi:AcrR family transcriptional regulator